MTNTITISASCLACLPAGTYHHSLFAGIDVFRLGQDELEKERIEETEELESRVSKLEERISQGQDLIDEAITLLEEAADVRDIEGVRELLRNALI